MGRSQAKTVNQTFSLPLDVSEDLHALVKNREMSRFVSDAIRKELNAKKQYLRKCYRQANRDEGQLEATNDWQTTLADGLDDW